MRAIGVPLPGGGIPRMQPIRYWSTATPAGLILATRELNEPFPKSQTFRRRGARC
jgi:hypothetical protein